ncbi:MAG: DUF3810 domain-containing protein [Oscillospiraceae bacterium]|nr:DUF3810 domain-containing protein [Oscillospiraceae bacterium]
MKKKRPFKKTSLILSAIFAVCIAANIAARFFMPYADFHRSRIFPVLMNIFARISGVFPFSVGEILILLGLTAVPGVIALFVYLTAVKKKSRGEIARVYIKGISWVLAVILCMETFNFLILYHCSTFASVYGISENEHTPERLFEVAVMIAEKANEASADISRNEAGRFVMRTDFHTDAVASMKKLGEAYPSFSGYYPPPKPLAFSKTATRLRLLGIYFPFSFEANYNKLIADIDKPSTVCHELAHLKGWILEDEANFIAFLACVYSDNPEFVYSGYADALGYIWTKVQNECPPDKYEEFLKIIDTDVWNDIYHSHDIFRKAKEETIGNIRVGEIISEVSETAIDANLIFNGVPDGSKSYGRFVDLLLNYYSED